MQRVKLDSAATAVKKFVRSLPIGPEGIELELDGKVVCKIISSSRLGDGERDALMISVKRALQKSRDRNRGVPASKLAAEVDRAVESVRSRKVRR